MEKKPKWIPRVRDYELEHRKVSIRGGFDDCGNDHPLRPGWFVSASKKNTSTAPSAPDEAKKEAPKPALFDDPLRALTGGAPVVDDPLRMMSSPSTSSITQPSAPAQSSAAAQVVEIKHTEALSSSIQLPVSAATTARQTRFEPWSAKKPRILKKYTTNKRIAVTANFLDEKDQSDQAPKSVDETARLELLEENPESEVAKQYLNQKEYIAHIEEQHENLKTAWENGERVLSLKIAIQCAKLLGDTKVPQFYPSMYVLLTDILDTFGDLVFERIKNKKSGSRGTTKTPPLSENFKASDVSTDAKETCRNWFFKTACIRELLPRLYIELSLIKCNRFLGDDQFGSILMRLCKGIRGVGDPLAATYARAYLCSRAKAVAPHCSSFDMVQNVYLSSFDDFLFSYRYLNARDFRGINGLVLSDGGDESQSAATLTVDQYLDLFSPALEWILANIGQKANEDLFFALLQQYKDYCNNSAVLVHLLGSFEPAYVAKHAMSMTVLIREAHMSTEVSKARLYLVLGCCLIASAPPKNQLLPILNDVWKVVTKIDNPHEYCEIAAVFVEYLLKHFTQREVNIFLKDVIKHVKKGGIYKELQEPLHEIAMKVLMFSKNFTQTLSMDNFLPVLDLLEKDTKISAAKHVLTALQGVKNGVSDPVILHTLFDVARSLHDSLDSLSFEDERRQISRLIVLFVRKIDFGRDLEKQLSTYVECRQAFTNLDGVTEDLVLRVALLATKAHKFMKGKHNKKTSAFVKACLAYCHITIPSLDDVFTRLRLFLVCGEVGLVNQMIGQAEGFLKAAISLIPDVPITREVDRKLRSTESDLVSFIQTFTAFLLFFPGHPEHGPFYLVNGLLNAIQKYEPWKQATPGKTRVYLNMLRLFCTYFQSKFPVRIQGVESNDRLYGGDPAFLKQVYVFVDTLMTETMAQLTELGEKGDMNAKKQQAQLALEFVNLLVDGLEMNNHSATLVVRLYQLAEKSGAASKAYLRNTLAHIQGKSGAWFMDISQKLVAR